MGLRSATALRVWGAANAASSSGGVLRAGGAFAWRVGGAANGLFAWRGGDKKTAIRGG